MTRRNDMTWHRSVLACALALLLPMSASAQDAASTGTSEPQAAASSADEGWTWVVAPYLWATSVKTNLREDAPPTGTDVDFSDIISKIDMAAQVHVEGQGDVLGAFADLTYLSLGDEGTHANSTTESSLDVSIFELAGVWNVDPDRYEGLDFFAGLRHFVVNADVKIDPTNPAFSPVEVKFDQSFSDLMIGARYNATLSERWGATLRVDGATGDTQGTINASALLRYKVGRGSWIFGYRYMDVELEAKGRDLDLTMSGPIVAFSFGF